MVSPARVFRAKPGYAASRAFGCLRTDTLFRLANLLGDGCRITSRVLAEESHSGRVDSIPDGEFNNQVGLARG